MVLLNSLLLFKGTGHTPCALKERSNLCLFLRKWYPLQKWILEKEGLTVENIIILLDHYVFSNSLFEKTNSEIVFCDTELSCALLRKAFHFSELFSLVEPHLLFYYSVPLSENQNFLRDKQEIWSSWKSGSQRMDRIGRLRPPCRRKSQGVSTVIVNEQLKLIIEPFLGGRLHGKFAYASVESALKEYLLSFVHNFVTLTIYQTEGTLLEHLTGARLVALQQLGPIIRANSKRFCRK